MALYKDQVEWKSVQPFLPEENRINSSNQPTEYFIPWRNCQIHVDHYQQKNPQATIVLFHGVGGNGRLLSFIAGPLFRNNYEIICPDLPLYGNTKTLGTITYDDWVECGKDIVERFQKENVPLFLFGLSAGGMLAYQVATECDQIMGIMATCLLDQRNHYITEQTARNKIAGSIGRHMINLTHKFFPTFKVPMKFVANMKAIVNDEELAKTLMRDKRSSGAEVPLSFLYSMLNPKIKVEPRDFTACPILLVHPEKDKWTDVHLSQLFFDKLNCKKSLKILDGAGHFPIEQTGLKQLERFCTDFIKECLLEK